MAVSTASYVYAGLLAAGGLMGFSKGSTASLIGGAGSGLVVAALEYAAARGSPSPDVASALSGAQVLVASGLAYTMGSRFANGGKFMPAGLVASMSAVMVLVFAARALQIRK